MTTTFLLLCGAGIGALITTLLLLTCMRLWTRNSIAKVNEETREFNRRNADLLEQRNEIGERQVEILNRISKSLCRHRHVTATESGCFCKHCGSVVEFNKASSNWE